MSSHQIHVLSADADATLDDEAEEAVRRVLADSFPSSEIRIRRFGGVVLVSAMGAFEAARCPRCQVDLSHPEPSWQAAMAASHRTGFRERRWTTPCCGLATTLDALAYAPEQGFASFEIVVADPGRDQLTDAEKARLTSALGTPVRLISVHV